MMNEKYNAPNSPCCGRPMHYAPANKCNFSDCCLDEYPHKMQACIRNQQPNCMAKAVIPSITVDTVDGITDLANCFVHVTSINTTYYVDDKHRPMMVWAGPVEADVPDTVTTEEEFLAFVKTFNLRSQHLYARFYSNDNNQYGIIDVYFDKYGRPYWAGEYYEMTEGPLL